MEKDLNRPPQDVRIENPSQNDRLPAWRRVLPLVPLGVLLAFAVAITGSAVRTLMIRATEGSESPDLMPLQMGLTQVFLILALFAQKLNRKKAYLTLLTVSFGVLAWFMILLWQAV